MKYLFKVSKDKIETLLNGKDFNTIENGIQFPDGKKVHYMDFNIVLVSLKHGYIAFTQYESECKALQKQIQEIYEGSEGKCRAKPLS